MVLSRAGLMMPTTLDDLFFEFSDLVDIVDFVDWLLLPTTPESHLLEHLELV